MRTHIISTFHYDVIYLKEYRSYLEESIRILDRALELLEREADYKFTVEQILPVREYCRRHPERRMRMRRLAQSGRLCFAPGMLVMPDMNLGGGETLFRQIEIGRSWLRDHLGVTPDACWIADCWGHHAQLPQMLSQSGYRSYFFWRGMDPEFRQNNFRWKGLDGTELLTHWLPRGYSGIFFPEKQPGIANAEEQRFAEASAEEIARLTDQERRFGASEQILICNGGDFRMPQESAPSALRAIREREPSSRIEFSTPTEYAAATAEEDLPVYAGEFNALFQGTFSTNIRIKQGIRRHTARLLAEEMFLAIQNRSHESLRTQWETVLKLCFHDTVCGTICDAALKSVQADLQALDLLTSSGDAVFNPTAHPRRETLELPDSTRLLVDLKPFETRSLREFPECPPLLPQNPEEGMKFETAYYTISIHRNGFLSSLRTARGTEWINSASPAAFGSLVMQNDNGDSWQLYEGPIDGGSEAAAYAHNDPDPRERPVPANDIVNRHNFYPTIREVRLFRSQESLRVVQKGEIGFWRNRVSFVSTMECDANSPLIRWKIRIRTEGRHYRLRAAFPTLLRNGTVTHEIPFGLQVRGHSEFPAETFCDYSGERGGITLFNRGLPGNNVDADGVMLLSLFRSAVMEYKCDSALSFQEGEELEAEFALMVREESSMDAVIAEAERYAAPLIPVPSTSPAVDLTNLRLPDNVRVSTLRSDGKSLFLRLYEGVGKATRISLSFPESFHFWRNANALGEGVDKPETLSGPLEWNLRPFEIKNLLLYGEHV